MVSNITEHVLTCLAYVPQRTCVTFLEKVNIEPITKKLRQVTLPIYNQRLQQLQHHAFLSSENLVSCRRRKKCACTSILNGHTVNSILTSRHKASLWCHKYYSQINQPTNLAALLTVLLSSPALPRCAGVFFSPPHTTAQLLNGFPSFPSFVRSRCWHRYKITLIIGRLVPWEGYTKSPDSTLRKTLMNVWQRERKERGCNGDIEHPTDQKSKRSGCWVQKKKEREEASKKKKGRKTLETICLSHQYRTDNKPIFVHEEKGKQRRDAGSLSWGRDT